MSKDKRFKAKPIEGEPPFKESDGNATAESDVAENVASDKVVSIIKNSEGSININFGGNMTLDEAAGMLVLSIFDLYKKNFGN